jgi:hypothetical protein
MAHRKRANQEMSLPPLSPKRRPGYQTCPRLLHQEYMDYDNHFLYGQFIRILVFILARFADIF